MSATETVQPTADLVAFAAQAWAFREPVRAQARDLVLETLLAATANARARRVEIAATGDTPGPARMRARAMGRPEITTPLRAAFLSALAVGDGATLATPVVCAAFAVAESVDAPGALVLDAVVAGTEVAVRLERALGPGHGARGWDARGTCGRVGAAIAAARVLTLQRDAVRDAVGIAATAASGLRSAAGTMVAAAIAAAAAADGVEAALLARADFTGALLPLEGRRGLAALMSATFDPALAVSGLGETFVLGSARSPEPFVDATAYAPLRALAARLERLASIRDVIDATMAAG
jgi:2-methylcitrate dehydratase PrpD